MPTSRSSPSSRSPSRCPMLLQFLGDVTLVRNHVPPVDRLRLVTGDFSMFRTAVRPPLRTVFLRARNLPDPSEGLDDLSVTVKHPDPTDRVQGVIWGRGSTPGASISTRSKDPETGPASDRASSLVCLPYQSQLELISHSRLSAVASWSHSSDSPTGGAPPTNR